MLIEYMRAIEQDYGGIFFFKKGSKSIADNRSELTGYLLQ